MKYQRDGFHPYQATLQRSGQQATARNIMRNTRNNIVIVVGNFQRVC